MSLGDETAATLGISPGGFRMTVFVVIALITAVMVAALVRLLFGGDNARVLPGSAFFGAVFPIWADAVAHVLM